MPGPQNTPWDRVSARVLRGICHDLNGRASALGGIAQLVRLGDGVEEGVADLLEGEVTHLEGLSQVLRMVVGDLEAPAEPLLLPDHLEALVPVFGRQRGFEGIRISAGPADVLPVLVNWTALSRSLLVLLSAAGGEGEGGVRGDVRVEFRNLEDGNVALEVRPPAPEDRARAFLEGAADYVAGMLPECRVSADGGAVTLVLPSLPNARRGVGVSPGP